MIVQTARTWVGVPFRDKGRTRAGVDCVGLLIAVARELDYPVEDVRNYGRVPVPEQMGTELERQMDRIAIGQAEPGDVFWFAWRRHPSKPVRPQHLGIYTGIGVIHATEAFGEVVEHPVNQGWTGKIEVGS